jgi:hypothetical protein
MVQLPAPVIVIVEPEFVQVPVVVKLTGRPDEAEAVTANGKLPNV